MSHSHEHSDLHMCLKIAKLVLSACTVAAAFCISKEIHKVHKALEEHNEKPHHKLL